jgi:phage-related protein
LNVVENARVLRPVRWVGSSRDDLRAFPKKVRQKVGFALYFAQQGQRHEAVKPLRGFGGGSVLEVVEDHARGTYRAVYTLQFREAVYVLHVFQKKSKQGIATAKRDVDLIRARLREAARIHVAHEGAKQ